MDHVEALAAVARRQLAVAAEGARPRVDGRGQHAVGARSVPLLAPVVREDAVRVETADALEGAGVVAVGRRRAVGSNDALSVVAAHSRTDGQRVGDHAVHTLHVVIREGVFNDLPVVSDALRAGEGAGRHGAGVVQDERVVVALQTLCPQLHRLSLPCTGTGVEVSPFSHVT